MLCGHHDASFGLSKTPLELAIPAKVEGNGNDAVGSGYNLWRGGAGAGAAAGPGDRRVSLAKQYFGGQLGYAEARNQPAGKRDLWRWKGLCFYPVQPRRNYRFLQPKRPG